MSARITVILGKGGVGKTFLAAHLAMALGYLGVKTLVVGADQKQDLVRSLVPEGRGGLIEWLGGQEAACDEICPDDVIVPVNGYVHVLELGPAPILSWQYGDVINIAFSYLAVHELLEAYEQVLFDITEERWDGTLKCLCQRADWAIAVTHETPESLFVLNRMFRAIQIGGYEYQFPMTPLGVVNNASRDAAIFQRYVARTQCFPLMSIPDSGELAALKPYHRTLFSLEPLPPALLEVQDGLVRIADLLRSGAMNVVPITTMNDGDIWDLAPTATLPN